MDGTSDLDILRGIKSIAVFVRLAPGLDKVATLTLQCHLLLDEELDRLLRLLAKDTTFLGIDSDNPPGFAAKMNWVRAFGPCGKDKRWNVIKKLNVVRNKVAHQIDRKARNEGIRELRSAFGQSYPVESKEPLKALKNGNLGNEDKESSIILGSYLLSAWFLHEIGRQIMGNDRALIAQDADRFLKKCVDWFNQFPRSGATGPLPPDPPLTGYKEDPEETTT